MSTRSQIDRGDEGKSKPSAESRDRGKSNRHGHHAGASGKKVKYSDVQMPKERGAASVQAARAAHHGGSKTMSGAGNAVKIMANIPDGRVGSDVPLIPNSKPGHFARAYENGAVVQISHRDD